MMRPTPQPRLRFLEPTRGINSPAQAVLMTKRPKCGRRRRSNFNCTTKGETPMRKLTTSLLPASILLAGVLTAPPLYAEGGMMQGDRGGMMGGMMQGGRGGMMGRGMMQNKQCGRMGGMMGDSDTTQGGQEGMKSMMKQMSQMMRQMSEMMDHYSGMMGESLPGEREKSVP